MFDLILGTRYVVFILNNLENGCVLTHWGRVTHIYVGKLTIIGSAKPLSEPALEFCQLDHWEQTSVKF